MSFFFETSQYRSLMAVIRSMHSFGLLDAVLAAVFCIGILVGGILLQKGYTAVNMHTADVGPKHGSIQQLVEVHFRKTSHIDEEGCPIVKQPSLEPSVVSNFVGYSMATFKPAGQIMMQTHEHKSLHEFFYVIEGTGIIQKDGIDNKVKPGTFLHMAPFEKYGIWVPKEERCYGGYKNCGLWSNCEK